MRSYMVDPALLPTRFPENDPQIKNAVGNLIDHLSIRNRRILSLGAGVGREERWLAEIGNNALTIIDIDEKKNLEPVMRANQGGAMRYIVGDVFATKIEEPFDVLYVPGLTPDEKRRYQISREPGKLDRFLKAALSIDAGQWPVWRGPVHSVVMRHARRLVPGGLLIVQSIGFSLDALYHKCYLDALQWQMRRHGFDLLEVWRYTNTVGVMLYIAQKRGGQSLRLRADLTTFHGRSPLREPIERIFPLPHQDCVNDVEQQIPVAV